MTSLEADAGYPAYTHPLVSWGSIIFGAVAAIAVGVLLNLLVAVFDGAATMHQIAKTGEVGDNALLLGVFGGLANLIALFTGGFVAARSANHPDHHDGMLHGLGVWAVSFVVAFALLGTGASKAVGTALNDTNGEAPAAGSAQTSSTDPSMQTGLTDPSTSSTAPMPPVTADQQKQAEADAAAETQEEGRAIAKAATQTAFFGFAAMLIGLVAALWGGVIGSRHPEHFAVRPRRRVIV